MQIIKGSTELNKAIASIANRGAKLDSDIHRAGVSVIAHASEHGDSTLADKLVQAMPKGGRKLALVEWMLAHGQVALLAAKEAKETGRTFKLDRTRDLNIEGAIEKSWTEFRKEAPVHTAFDAQAAVKALLAKMNAASAKGLSIENKAAALSDAKALVALLEVQ